MRSWKPPPGEPELLDWWQPLLAVSRRARAERVPWPVHPEEFVLRGRVDRPPRPAVWVYEHRHNGGEMLADGEGRTYAFVAYRSGRHLGRFREIGVRNAVWRARLPEVVEPVWYEEPRPDCAPRRKSLELALPEPVRAHRRRSHLRLVVSAPGGD